MSRHSNASNNVRVGRTIAGEWERQESESERLAARKKAKNKKIAKTLLLLASIVVIAGIVIMEVSVWINNIKKEEEAAKVIQPTVEIIDEAGTGITPRMKEYIGKLERDFADLGMTVNRAVVPAGMMREVHVFLNGYDYYIKINIDKESAVSAEDAKRMINYVTEHNIKPEYIDVRVKGKGYYK